MLFNIKESPILFVATIGTTYNEIKPDVTIGFDRSLNKAEVTALVSQYFPECQNSMKISPLSVTDAKPYKVINYEII